MIDSKTKSISRAKVLVRVLLFLFCFPIWYLTDGTTVVLQNLIFLGSLISLDESLYVRLSIGCNACASYELTL